MSTIADTIPKETVGKVAASLALPAIILLGIVLRFHDLGAESYWVDEVTMLRVAGGSVESILAAAQGGRPPVYVLTAHYWLQSFGTAEGAARALSAVFGSISLLLMYVVGRTLFGRGVGLISTLLMALSEFQIYVSQDLRYYSLLLLFALLSFLSLVRALGRARPLALALYVGASVLLFYTHTYGIFVLAAQALYLSLHWRELQRALAGWLIALGLVSLAVAPGFLLAFGQTATGDANVLQWIPDPAPWQLLATLWKYVFPARALPEWPTFAAGIAFFAGVTVPPALRLGGKRWLAAARGLMEVAAELRSRKANELLLVGLWFLCPILLPFVLSKVFGPMYIHRYTIAAAPAFYLLLALAMTAARRAVPLPASLGLVAILIAPGLLEYYVTDVKEQWRETAAYVQANAQTGDVIVFAPGENGALRRTFNWYYRGDLPQCDLPTGLKDDAAIADALANCAASAERFWLILRGNPDRLRAFRDYFLDRQHTGSGPLAEQSFTDVSVYLFAWDGNQERGSLPPSLRQDQPSLPPSPPQGESQFKRRG